MFNRRLLPNADEPTTASRPRFSIPRKLAVLLLAEREMQMARQLHDAAVAACRELIQRNARRSDPSNPGPAPAQILEAENEASALKQQVARQRVALAAAREEWRPDLERAAGPVVSAIKDELTALAGRAAELVNELAEVEDAYSRNGLPAPGLPSRHHHLRDTIANLKLFLRGSR